MKAILLSTGFATAMGFAALTSANAAPIATHGVIAAPEVTTQVQCRTVKRVVYRGGVKRVTTTRSCAPAARVYVAPRRYYRAPRPGITVRVR